MKLETQLFTVSLARLRRQFAEGDQDALIEAVALCHMQEVVAPKWVATAFVQATRAWRYKRTKERGEAFGPGPKGKHIASALRKRHLKLAVYNDISAEVEADTAIDDVLFARIGKAHGLSVTLVKELWRVAREEYEGLPLLTARRGRKK